MGAGNVRFRRIPTCHELLCGQAAELEEDLRCLRSTALVNVTLCLLLEESDLLGLPTKALIANQAVMIAPSARTTVAMAVICVAAMSDINEAYSDKLSA
jgi:hypothetical protein